MTRMEKYADYRREIMQMKDESENTKKSQASRKVSEILKKEDTLALEDVLSGLDIYQNEEINTTKHLSLKQKRKIIYISVCSIIIVALLVLTIVIGVNTFGGK